MFLQKQRCCYIYHDSNSLLKKWESKYSIKVVNIPKHIKYLLVPKSFSSLHIFTLLPKQIAENTKQIGAELYCQQSLPNFVYQHQMKYKILNIFQIVFYLLELCVSKIII